jgi:hypothetical protein
LVQDRRADCWEQRRHLARARELLLAPAALNLSAFTIRDLNLGLRSLLTGNSRAELTRFHFAPAWNPIVCLPSIAPSIGPVFAELKWTPILGPEVKLEKGRSV